MPLGQLKTTLMPNVSVENHLWGILQFPSYAEVER